MGWNDKTGRHEWGHQSEHDRNMEYYNSHKSTNQNSSSGSSFEERLIIGLIKLPFKALKFLLKSNK